MKTGSGNFTLSRWEMGLSGGRTLKGAGTWLVAMGIATLLLGFFALTMSLITTLVSVFFIGGLLILASIFQGVYAVSSERWPRFFLHVALTILYLMAGLFLVLNPLVGAVSLSILIAYFFVVSGGFRFALALSERMEGWVWGLVSGLVTLALGIYVLLNLETVGLFLLGILFAVDLIFLGSYLLTSGLAVKRLREATPAVKP
ncbi:MAG TPA: DUF308 domain-containing protein [Pseudobdellovibrionaceae bacterium]|nr:DUF308 domain-containing protein [Pseudobdellovibrionaceae bacterium]